MVIILHDNLDDLNLLDWYIGGGGHSYEALLFVPLSVLDLPFSAVADTVLLPVTIPFTIWDRPRREWPWSEEYRVPDE